MALLDRVIFTAVSAGTATFQEASAVTGFQTLEAAGAVSGTTYSYVAQSSDLLQWEYGRGGYTSGSPSTLSRSVILNSLGTTAAIDFLVAPQVMLTVLAEDVVPPLAGNNLTFYVDPAGNDANPGTQLLPFLTIQHAADVAATYDWENLYAPTIQLAVGTYSMSATVTLPALINIDPVQALPTIIGDFGTPANYVLSNNFFSLFTVVGDTNNWSLAGIEAHTNASVVGLDAGAVFDIDVVNLNSNTGGAIVAICTKQSSCTIEQMTMLSNITSLANLDDSFCTAGATIDFGGFNVQNMLTLNNFSKCQFTPSLSNTGGCVGTRVALTAYSFVVTTNGALTDIPGGSDGSFDSTCALASLFGGLIGNFALRGAGSPTTAQIPAKTWTVYKDTSGGTMYIAANDSGTIEKAPLTTNQFAFLDVADQTVTGGANVTSDSLATGNIAIDCGARPLQYITNGGAFTITAPSSDGSCMVLVTNNASAGAIAFSGFTVGSNTGDALDTTNGHQFTISVWRINSISGYRIAAHQ